MRQGRSSVIKRTRLSPVAPDLVPLVLPADVAEPPLGLPTQIPAKFLAYCHTTLSLAAYCQPSALLSHNVNISHMQQQATSVTHGEQKPCYCYRTAQLNTAAACTVISSLIG